MLVLFGQSVTDLTLEVADRGEVETASFRHATQLFGQIMDCTVVDNCLFLPIVLGNSLANNEIGTLKTKINTINWNTGKLIVVGKIILSVIFPVYVRVSTVTIIQNLLFEESRGLFVIVSVLH